MNFKIFFRLSFGLFILMGLLSSCDRNRFFEQNFDLPKVGWHVDSVKVFQFSIEDTQAKYNVYYNIRNTLEYPHYNLYVTYYLEDPKGKIIQTELQNITLMNSKTGEPFGSGLGDIFTHQLLIPTFNQYKFPTKGKYTFKIKQYMRRDPLPGIQTVGLRIEKVN